MLSWLESKSSDWHRFLPQGMPDGLRGDNRMEPCIGAMGKLVLVDREMPG